MQQVLQIQLRKVLQDYLEKLVAPVPTFKLASYQL